MPLLRLAEPRDVAVLEEIENSADALLVDYLHATEWAPAPSGHSRAAMPGFLLIVAEPAGREAVGFAHVLEVDGDAHLEQLSVRPESGRQGFGRALVQAALAEASARGCAQMTLRTYSDVPWNAPFYSTCGFAVSEPATNFQQKLVDVEDRLHLAQYAPRVQMTAPLSR